LYTNSAQRRQASQLSSESTLCPSRFANWDESKWHVQVDDLAWAIMREISKMCYNPVEEDVVRAKNQLKAAILFSQDNLSGAWSITFSQHLSCCSQHACITGKIEVLFPALP